MLNDPKNSHVYEHRIWKMHNDVTYHKNEYYRQKNSASTDIINAYVSFRSMEGKQRILYSYQLKSWRRVLAQCFCGMKSVFRRKMLLEKGYYDLEDAAESDDIIWEHHGIQLVQTLKKYAAVTVICVATLLFTAMVFMLVADQEKARFNYVKNDCSLESYNQEQAYIDLLKDPED